MNFGEKLFILRKEKGLSQEALAEQIGTTRQAISKWENNQGFPETEKLLLLSNIFEVSVDFLLKENSLITEASDKGYYVSKEMATGYLANEKKVNKYVSIGSLFWVLSGIPYVMFTSENSWRILGIAVCVTLGIGAFILGAFKEKEEYRILRQEPLLFDYDYLKKLTNEYNAIKKKHRVIAIPCSLLFVLCIIIIFITAKGYIAWTQYHSIAFLGIAVGLFGLIQSVSTIELYELLVKNEQYCNHFWFRVKRKVRSKIDNF